MNPDKPVHARNVPTPTDRPRGQIAPGEIAARAKRLWHERGRPSGQDDVIRFEAESLLQAEAESQPVSGTPSRPYVDEPAKPVRTQTKNSDPTDAAAQTRSATDSKSKQSTGKLRNQ